MSWMRTGGGWCSGALAALRYLITTVRRRCGGWWLNTFDQSQPDTDTDISIQHYSVYVCYCASKIWVVSNWLRWFKYLTSNRKRGLSGMKTTPMSAASAGKRHTKINSLQLWIWNSVPMAKPQPGGESSKEQVNIQESIFLAHVDLSNSQNDCSSTQRVWNIRLIKKVGSQLWVCFGLP